MKDNQQPHNQQNEEKSVVTSSGNTAPFAKGIPVSCSAMPKRKITLTLGVFFDGTGNNAFNSTLRQKNCSAESVGYNDSEAQGILNACEADRFGLRGDIARISYDGSYTNIHCLYNLYRNDSVPDFSTSEENLQFKYYVEGIGTINGESDSSIGMATGRSSTGIIAKTNRAIDVIKESLPVSLEYYTNVEIVKIQFDIFGFSRGAAAARHFSNRIRKRDNELFSSLTDIFQSAEISILNLANHSIRFMGLFDTVAAVATPVPSSSDTGDVNIYLPVGIAKRVFHITAEHEFRHNFSLNSVKPGYPELSLPGAHSDIGGGYHPLETEDYLISRPEYNTVPVSMENNSTSAYKRSELEKKARLADPIWGPMLQKADTWIQLWDEPVPSEKQSGRLKYVGAAIRMQRNVSNGWSLAILRVMLDAAEEAGCIFDKGKINDRYPVPAVLHTLMDKARAQGKAIRKGENIIPFNSDELALLAEKYIHCSANWKAIKKNPKTQQDIFDDGASFAVIFFPNRPTENGKRNVYDLQGKKL
ncbi:T6SS phospholipase effector Tle1-like catalytic domain-containing protein [Sodalis sp. RH15]|uniref:T6SS phospholipase effector Tle1-like catalytic domain-containing protein n=1 Tax=Sodalis sp. RH15 TaxID=3394330 RepID=UPI0039B4BF48